MKYKEIKSLYRQSLKSMDTEEHIDLFFYRPLGFAWAWLFAKLGVTPNVVTIASIFLGVGGGILLYLQNLPTCGSTMWVSSSLFGRIPTTVPTDSWRASPSSIHASGVFSMA